MPDLPPLVAVRLAAGQPRADLLPDLGRSRSALLVAAPTCSSRAPAARSARCAAARVMAESFGVDTARLKIVVFVSRRCSPALSGWLYAHMHRFVSPTPFDVNASIEYLFMAVVGGAGHVWGAVVGASVLTLLKERLQDLLPRCSAHSGNFEIMVFGAADPAAAAPRARAASCRCSRAGCRAAQAAPAPLPAAAAAAPRRCPRGRAAARGASGAASASAAWSRSTTCRFEVNARRDPRPDRPQRRRQEHDVQPRSPARCRATAARSRSSASASTACRRATSRGSACAHLPARAS